MDEKLNKNKVKRNNEIKLKYDIWSKKYEHLKIKKVQIKTMKLSKKR